GQSLPSRPARPRGTGRETGGAGDRRLRPRRASTVERVRELRGRPREAARGRPDLRTELGLPLSSPRPSCCRPGRSRRFEMSPLKGALLAAAAWVFVLVAV